MLVYLAGPIESSPDQGRSWRASAASILEANGWASFSPPHAFCGVKLEDAPVVCRLNREVIRRCNAVLAQLGGFETIREVEFARLESKPVFAFPDLSLTESLGYWDLHCYSTWEIAAAALVELVPRG